MKMTLVFLFSLLIVFPAHANVDVDTEVKDDLIIAAKKGNALNIKVLLGKGADVNATAKQGWTALLWATVNGHTDVVKLLIDNGANVNQKNKLDWSALDYAKLKGHTEIVKLLKQHGAKE